MTTADPFAVATPGVQSTCQLAEVVSVEDPERLGRVQVRISSADGVEGHDGPIWARVATPFAGAERGAFLLPDVGDEVLVAFVQGDARMPIVVGGLWNGSAAPPESLPGDRVDRWTIVGKAGTRIAIVEENSGQATIKLTTPGGARAELTDAGGGKIELSSGGSTVTIKSSGVTVRSGGSITVQGSQVQVSAGMVSVNAGLTQCSGVLQCDVLLATTVVASMYTPGAGNLW